MSDTNQQENDTGPVIGQSIMPEAAEDDVHHATITGVRLLRKDDGRCFFIIKVSSHDKNYVNTLDLQIPNGFDDGVAEGSKFDPMKLPEDDENGRQQSLYRVNFANRKNDAWLQRLVFGPYSLARKFGKKSTELDIILKPQTLEDYAHNLHEMLSGVECLMMQRGGKIWNLVAETDDFKDAKWKGYKFAWEKN